MTRTTEGNPGLRAGPVSGLLVLSSLLFIAAFPPWGLWACILLAPVPLALAARGAARARVLLLMSLLAGMGTWMVLHAWVLGVTVPGYWGLCVYGGLWVALQALCLRALIRGRLRLPCSIALPTVLVGLDWLRGFVVFDGYPWYLWGQPLIDFPFLAGLAALGGVSVPAFIALAFSGLLADGLLRRRGSPGAPATFAPGGLILLCGVVLSLLEAGPRPTPERTRSVLMVQTDLPTSNKIRWSAEAQRRDVRGFMNLSAEGVRGARDAGRRVDLVVWPETMLPSVGFEHGDLFTRSIESLVGELGVPFLIGTGSYPDLRPGPDGRMTWDREYNSAYLVTPAGPPYQRVDKVFLTPFGETMPYISNWPWLEERLLAFGAAGMAFELDAGERIERPVLPPPAPGLEPVAFAVPICFEDTMAEVVRDMVWQDGARAAGLLVNISNDGWFGDHDSGRAMHTLCARWRAIENDLWLVRVSNTGESVLVDPDGRVVDRLPGGTRTSGTRLVEVGVSESGPTAFARLGETFGLLCWLATTLGLVVEWWSRRAARTRGTASETIAQGGAP